MKISIDARFFGPETTGVGKYVEKLIENLQDLDKENTYYILLRKANFPLFTPKASNFQKVLANASWYSAKEQVILPAVLSRLKPDLVHFPHFNIPLLYPGKFVVTIHDITKSEFKGTAATTRSRPVYAFKHSIYEFTIRQAIKRAKKILVPSKFVKSKLLKNFGIPEEKVVVTYEAADKDRISPDGRGVSEGRKKQILSRYSLKEPFILYVGNAFPYKNLEVVLRALNLINKDLYFVHASSKNFFVERMVEKATEMGLKDRYIVTGFVPNEDLAVLFQIAQCLVFPSLSEGFGLPGLEAMVAGCPVIASGIGVFKEVYGDAAEYFNPKDPRELAKKIQLITNNSKLRTQLVDKGFEQVEKYSWKKMAEETLKTYEEVLRK